MSLERHPGEWTYDPEAGAAYFYLYGAEAARSADMVELKAMVNLDYGEDGRPIGLEVIADWPEVSALAEMDDAPWGFKVVFTCHGAPAELMFDTLQDAETFAAWLVSADAGASAEIVEVGQEESAVPEEETDAGH